MFESGSNDHTDGNERWTLRAALAAGEDKAIARVVIDKAKAGDVTSARFLLRLLCPRPRGRTITLALPADTHAGDVMAAFDATLAALAVGKITPDEALTVTRVLDWRLRALKNHLLDAERRDWAKMRSAAGAKTATGHQEPSPSERGQGEGSCNPPAGAGKVSPNGSYPNPPERLSKGPEGEGVIIGSSPLHSTCIRPASAAAPAVSPPPHSG
jgi:hypothetical protein